MVTLAAHSIINMTCDANLDSSSLSGNNPPAGKKSATCANAAASHLKFVWYHAGLPAAAHGLQQKGLLIGAAGLADVVATPLVSL